ncbi:MAG: alanine dehydrogenase [Ornithinimicrobium sp.]|uniref:alanine dehydrogenase n=1 Tax=Ornithinimicrobium sp. TaxID=1977084 RepID=UPI003D9B500C
MRIGVPKEVKNHEYRVSMTPAGVHELAQHGHEVVLERGAGLGSSITDEEYLAAGASIAPDADETWGRAEMVMKVKEPVEQEYHRLRDDLVLFTYLHLAASQPCTDALVDAGTVGIAYETVQAANRSLPLLYPMSEVAGCIAPQAGANALLRANGGRGLLLGGVSGVDPAKVVVLGGGVSGAHAATMALGLWADVTVLDTDVEKLRVLDRRWNGRIKTATSNKLELERHVLAADMVVGAVLIPGARAPRLVTNELVSRMKPGSVLVDIAIDQGGCFEDSRPTTHDDPIYQVHDSIFYCVANMPGAVPRTSTFALTNVTLPYAVSIADKGWRQALRDDAVLAPGLNTAGGRVTNAGVAQAHGMPLLTVADALGG